MYPFIKNFIACRNFCHGVENFVMASKILSKSVEIFVMGSKFLLWRRNFCHGVEIFVTVGRNFCHAVENFVKFVEIFVMA